MRNIDLPNVNLRQIHFGLLLLIVLTLPFFTVFNSFLIILLSLNFLLALWIDGKKIHFNRVSVIMTGLFSSIFLIYLLLVIGSGVNKYGYVLERKFTLIVIPLILGSSFGKLTKKELDKILGFFLLSVFASVLFALVSYPSLLSKHDMALDIDSHLVMRRPYMGLYTLFSISLCVYFVFKFSNIWLRLCLIVLAVFFAYFSYMIYVKMAIIGFLICGMALYTVYAIHARFYKQLIFVVVVIVCLVAVAFSVSNSFQEIVRNIVHLDSFDFKEYSWIYFLSFNIRFSIWSCCYDVLSQDNNWIFGAGLNHQLLLDKCYANDLVWTRFGVDKTYLDLGKSMFNAHNQWLQIWLDCGLLGLLIISVIITTAILRSMQQRNFLYLFFTLFFFSCCLTESILEVQRGIVFYAFFNSLFVFDQPENPI